MATFELTDEQVRKAVEWRNAHRCKFDKGTGAIGGRFTYMFTGTSIGEIANLKCACGAVICLTGLGDL